MGSRIFLQEYSTTSSISVPAIEIKELSTGTERAATLRQKDAEFGEVISNAVLTAHGKPVKRHIGMSPQTHKIFSNIL
jgi:hypothetical protein